MLATQIQKLSQASQTNKKYLYFSQNLKIHMEQGVLLRIHQFCNLMFIVNNTGEIQERPPPLENWENLGFD